MAERPASPRPKSPTVKGIRSMEEVLTQHHLKYLLEDTFDSQTKWRFIGLYLGLPPPTLDAIGKKFDSSDEQYAEVLQKWLQSGVTPTMRKLIEALESNTVKENNIATQLRSKYTMKTTPLLKEPFSTMVSKDYFRAALAHDPLEHLREESEEMEYLRRAGKRAFLKSKEADITQLISASASGDRKPVQLLLGMGADVNMRDSWGQTAVYCASVYGHSEVVKLLVQAGADLELHTEEDQDTPLTISSGRGHSEVVRLLLEAGANINHQNKCGQTAVFCASVYGHSEVVKLFVQAGADLELHTEEDQATPLTISSDRGHSEVVRVLLEAGANFNHQDKWGQTAVYCASAYGYSEVVKLLVQGGVDLELQHKENQATPLSISSDRGHSEVVRVLLEAGANFNHQDKYQLTALMFAAGNGHIAVVKELLTRQDLNINMIDKDGHTAVDWALRKGHSEISQLILSAYS